jgi:hypothetical protein
MLLAVVDETKSVLIDREIMALCARDGTEHGATGKKWPEAEKIM